MSGPVPLVLQAIEALKRGERRGGAALLQQDVAQGSPSPDRCRTISRLAAEIGEIDLAVDASRRSLSPPKLYFSPALPSLSSLIRPAAWSST